MSELIKNNNRATARWRLLTGVSGLALGACISAGGAAKADDASHPVIWLELDGQFADESNRQEAYDPSFLQVSPFDASAHVNLERPPSVIWDGGAKLAYQPDGSDWLFSVGVRYGKSTRSKTINHQTTHASIPYNGHYLGWYAAYQIFKVQSASSHMVVDFQAGKDVGLGMFGSRGHSVLSAGVRIAQFNSQSAVGIQSQPTNHVGYGSYHVFLADFTAKRKFSGIGPSISLDESADIAGNSASGAISLDWGVNASVLFGRQRGDIHHKTTNSFRGNRQYISNTQTSGGAPRDKNVTVPNLGGFAALSWHYPSAKVSLGYRADFFFGAMDGGIDAAHRENIGFYGPFASVNVGIGG